MADYNVIFDAGDIDNGLVTTVVEIPKWSTLKIEWDRAKAVFKLDRVEPSIFAKPCNYGFIPQTLDDDGDELDTLVLTNDPIQTGIVVEARIIGVLNFEDDGEMDHKIICVPADDRNTGDAITSIDQLHGQWKLKIEHHFNHYKDLKKPGSTKVLGWGDAEAAKEIIRDCQSRWASQG
ncbi:inorganic diphosphatase [Candidatus Saccharibacteria bacterium]|jgi:inorganic pyrophosphatase|nr:inorganic diphosphatase [Candidatus Saccharibacteria bacterium]